MIGKWKKHLRDCEWSYWEHLAHGLHQCARLSVLTFKGIIHSFVPGIWPAEAPVGIYRMYKDMRKLKHVQRIYQLEDLKNP